MQVIHCYGEKLNMGSKQYGGVIWAGKMAVKGKENPESLQKLLETVP